MSQNYYYLVAGLKEYQMDSQVKGFDALAIRSDISSQISTSDRKHLELLYARYDVENILSAREGKSKFNSLGNMTQEEIAELLIHPEKFDTPLSRVLNAYAEAQRAHLQTKGNTVSQYRVGIAFLYYLPFIGRGAKFCKLLDPSYKLKY